MCKREKWERGKTGRADLDDLIHQVIGGLIRVHTELGPGFLENIYHRAAEIEFRRQNIAYETEKEISLRYLGEKIGMHRLDLMIERELVVELKTVEKLAKKHYAQVRSYLKAVGKSVGLLVNFSDFKLDARRVELDK